MEEQSRVHALVLYTEQVNSARPIGLKCIYTEASGGEWLFLKVFAKPRGRRGGSGGRENVGNWVYTSYFILNDAQSLRHNTEHAYNEDYAFRITRKWHRALRQSQHASKQRVSSWGLANILAWKVMQSLLPSSLHYIVSFLIAPAQTDGECKPKRGG
jgi:hypothetical protein